MKPAYVLQEVLLFTNTNFSRKQFCTTKDTAKETRTLKEQLEEACWNGLLPGLLPEIVTTTLCNKKIFTWEVNQFANLIYIKTGNIPAPLNKLSSINPTEFIFSMPKN